MGIPFAANQTRHVDFSLSHIVPLFNPWSYDTNGDGIISPNEAASALLDCYAGIITEEQMQQVFTLHMNTYKEYPPIEVVCLDSNNNGVVDEEDEANFLAAYPSNKGDGRYQRRFDANIDEVINSIDYAIFYGTLGKELRVIRNRVKTSIYEHLVWPDGWDIYIVALNKDRVTEFIGSFGESKEGWIDVRHHTYSFPSYICQQFAVDTMVAAYKGLGYGCLLGASSVTDGYSHAFNVFWAGGDWRNLNNWWVIEPQQGTFIGSVGDSNLPGIYQPVLIYIPDFLIPGTNDIAIRTLIPNYQTRSFSLGSVFESRWGGGQSEEPIVEVFNRALGVV